LSADFAAAVAASADTDITHYAGSHNTITLSAVRDGKSSWQAHTVTYSLTDPYLFGAVAGSGTVVGGLV
jgi:hypothetical protein